MGNCGEISEWKMAFTFSELSSSVWELFLLALVYEIQREFTMESVTVTIKVLCEK